MRHVSGSEGAYKNSIEGLTHNLLAGGFAPAQTNAAAMQQLYRQLGLQANLLSYIDIIRFFAYAALCMVPLVFLMKKVRGGGAAMH